MISQQEKQRLMQAYAAEPVCVAAVIAKCSVCLALLAGIAVIGATSTSFDESVQAPTGNAQVAKVSPQGR